MFWRLFATYVLLVLTAVGLVVVLIIKHGEPDAYDLAVAAALIVVTAAAPAYLLAQTFARPLAELIAGARRLADGDLSHRVDSSGGAEHIALADTLNTMRGRLASSIADIRHEREQLRVILSGMVEGVVAIEVDQKVVFANDRAGELLGFAPEEAVGQKLWQVVGQRAFQEAVEAGLAGTNPHRAALEWKGPPDRNLDVYVSRFRNPADPGAVVVVHDTTEVRQVERMRQEFVANASHELKTPLAIIKSNVEALADGAVDDPAVRGDFLARITLEADRLEALIKDMLSLAKVESGALGLEPRRVPLSEAVEASMDRFQARAEEKTLTLVERPPKDGPPGLAAWADPEALRQVLDNLVDNAIKYTLGGGKVTARWGGTADRVWFEVEDTGIGIPDRDLPRVFERFYRVDKARSREMGGTGLGLAIVKHLVQAMKGQVKVSSEVGKGTTFRVHLPRAGG